MSRNKATSDAVTLIIVKTAHLIFCERSSWGSEALKLELRYMEKTT